MPRTLFVDFKSVKAAITMEQMLQRCVTIMAEQRVMPAARARALMQETLPRLKQWNAGPRRFQADDGRHAVAVI